MLPEAHWSHLKSAAKQPTIGQHVDDVMTGIKRDNPSLECVLPKDYARPALDKQRLGQLFDLISNIRVGDASAFIEIFDSMLQPLFQQRIHEADDESRTLAALCGTLLPKLISGELRVKNNEKLAEAVS